MLFVEPIDPPDIQSWHITPETPDQVAEAITFAAQLGYTGTTEAIPQPNTDPVVVHWSLRLQNKRAGVPDVKVPAGDYLVFDGLQFRCVERCEFVATYTADVPMEWDSAVVAEALPSDQVRLTFDQPTSCNGPFLYSVEAHDFTDNKTTHLNLISQSAEDGRVVLVGDGLITGHGYTFRVRVQTRYAAEPYESEPTESVVAFL